MSQPDQTGPAWGAAFLSDPTGAAMSRNGAARAAIARASGASGVDFNYLLAQAKLESSLDPNARAATSSARGLYQFTNSTWAQTLQKHGDMLGLNSAALADPVAASRLMALRDDPNASAMMAAGLAGDNQAALSGALGRAPDASEMYLAHFLGADGAINFLKAMDANPDQSAASVNPKAAASNRSIFFDTSGNARSLGQVMALIRGKMANAMQGEEGVDPSMLATLAPATDMAVAATPASVPTGGPIAQAFAAARDNAMGTGIGAGGGTSSGSMADTIQTMFAMNGEGATAASATAASANVRAAYGKLKAFGL